MGASKILVVEDEGLVGLEITQTLAQMGYDVLPAVSSGSEALEQTAQERPDLVLMDIRLEGPLDGIDTALKIRERHGIPVVYLTAHSDESTLQRAKQSEAFGYLLKPFETRTLRAAVETALYTSRKEREREDEAAWDRTMGDSLPEALVATDTEGVIRSVNPAAARLVDREPAACVGALLADVFPLTDPLTRQPYLYPLSSAVVEERTICSDRLLQVGAGDRRTYVEFMLRPVKNRYRSAVGVICLLKPVRETERMEKSLWLELEKTRAYQLGLLPAQGRSVRGVRTNWLFRPSAFGSGDVFNVFPLDDHRVGFYLLDVMGHGFQSAVLAVTVYSFLSADVTRTGILSREAGRNGGDDGLPSLSEEGVMIPAGPALSPGEVIAELNRRFYVQKEDNPFFTLVYGVIDTSRDRVTLARAGHLFPLAMDPLGKVERITVGGQAIGAFPDIHVEEREFDFRPGSRLFLFSDGLLEALAGRERRSEADDDPLRAFLSEHARAALPDLCVGLDALVGESLPDPLVEDDIAFFALERE